MNRTSSTNSIATHAGLSLSRIFFYLMACSAMFMGQAHANLVIENEPASLEAVIPTLTLMHVGTVKPVTLVRHNIVNMDYTKALKSVAPEGWRGFATEATGILTAGKISIKAAKRPWTDVLTEMLEAKSFVAVVNWDSKEINVKSRH